MTPLRSTPEPAPDIAALHRAYSNLTGLDVRLDMERERLWFEWLRYRPDDPFTAADLKLVIDFLARGIRSGDRRPGSLRFSNLIGNWPQFDEERAAARKAAALAARPRPPATVAQTTPDPGGHTTRIVPADASRDTSRPAAEVSAKALEELRKLKETLRNP